MIIFLIAVLFFVIGHIIKSFRWKQLLALYEDINFIQLLFSISVSQTINMLIPCRLGDVYRIWRVGKKNLQNGYILALATVVVDIFIDVIMVGLTFIILYVLNIHRGDIREITFQYTMISAGIGISGILLVLFKKYIKRLISVFAALFNNKIERQILMTAYTFFESAKDVFRKCYKLFGFTVGIWTCYFISYDFFALFLQKSGYDFTLTKVFKTIFSLTGNSLLIEFLRNYNNFVWFWFLVYLILPLLLIYVITLFFIKRQKKNCIIKKIKIIPQMNENEKLAFLSIYFEGKNREYFDSYLKVNKDVSVLHDCSAGSNATTILAMSSNETFYRKYAFGADAEKLVEQIQWLETYKEQLPLCTILNKHIENGTCYYDMEYLNNAIGFFKYIHTNGNDGNWKILSTVLEVLNERLYSKTKRLADEGALSSYIEKKILGNIDVCNNWCQKYYNDLFKAEIVYVNGVGYHNLQYYEKYLNNRYLQEVFRNDKYASIHGDLTIENIVCLMGEDRSWYLIDPNTGSMHETPYLDYAKLLQSLHGKYEFLMMVKNVNVEENRIEYMFTGSVAYQELYESYKDYIFRKFSFNEARSIYYHEAVHWLRLMPYKIRKNPETAVIFYAGMLMVLHDIENMFEK